MAKPTDTIYYLPLVRVSEEEHTALSQRALALYGGDWGLMVRTALGLTTGPAERSQDASPTSNTGPSS